MMMVMVMVMVMVMMMVMVVETSLKKAVAKAPWCGGGGDVAVQAHLRQGKVDLRMARGTYQRLRMLI